ncbi:MAG: hypothetical protein H7Y88_03190 [Phycisphaerales bacterium]|nr:hypothetical protein [Phycisphaerales bacterium]
MTHRHCRGWPINLAVLLSLLLFLSRTAPALAQPDTKPTITAQWGFSPTTPLIHDRWGPVYITVVAATAFAGDIVVRYREDSSQIAAISTPISVTPGRPATVQVMVRIPQSADSVIVELYKQRADTGAGAAHPSESGFPIRRLNFQAGASGAGDSLPLPIEPLADGVLLLGITARGTTDLELDAFGRTRGARVVVTDHEVATCTIDPSASPLSWIGFDSVGMLVVEATAAHRMDERALAAVRQWVTRGGALTIIAGSPGDDWKLWLPPAFAGDLLALAPLTTEPVPGALAAVVAAGPPIIDPDYVEFETPSAWGDAGPPAQSEHGWERSINSGSEETKAMLESWQKANLGPLGPSAPRFDAALVASSSMAQRRISLLGVGDQNGWKLLYTPTGSADGARQTGAAAIGPVGFGTVCVLGFYPRDAASIGSARATQAVYLDVLSAAGCLVAAAKSPQPQWFGGVTPSVSDSATNAMLDEVCDVPVTGRSTFLFIAAGMAVLALMLGPGDFFLLKKLRLRHRSWLTALLWISLATALAYFGPTAIRSGDTGVRRVSAIDAIDHPDHPLGWQSSITGVFAASSMRLGLSDTQGQWWNGVAPINWYSDQTKFGALFPRVQGTAGLAEAGDDPWGGLLPKSGDSCRPAPIWQRMWTMRSFHDEGRVPLPFRTRVLATDREVAADTPILRIEGLPPGTQISAPALCLGSGRWRSLAAPVDPVGPDGVVELYSVMPETAEPPVIWASQSQSNQYDYSMPRLAPVATNPGTALQLLGPRARAGVISTYLQSGRWGLVLLRLHSMPSDVHLEGAQPRPRQLICRVLVPLPAEPADSDSTTSESSQP